MHLDESIDEVMTPEATYDDDEYKLFLQKKRGGEAPYQTLQLAYKRSLLRLVF